MIKAVRREKDRLRSEITEGIAEYRETAAEHLAVRARRARIDRCGTLACAPAELWRYLVLYHGGDLVPFEPRPPGHHAFLH